VVEQWRTHTICFNRTIFTSLLSRSRSLHTPSQNPSERPAPIRLGTWPPTPPSARGGWFGSEGPMGGSLGRIAPPARTDSLRVSVTRAECSHSRWTLGCSTTLTLLFLRTLRQREKEGAWGGVQRTFVLCCSHSAWNCSSPSMPICSIFAKPPRSLSTTRSRMELSDIPPSINSSSCHPRGPLSLVSSFGAERC
jgi:hypothetical protein